MCGIAGAVGGRHSPDEAVRIGRRMAQAVAHRGSDGEGVWADADAGVILAHRRLSIIELSEAGAQPFSSRDTRYTLVFNGEIYNHLEIRDELERRGKRVWAGRSDTETLIEAIAQWGLRDTLGRLRGMFAIALWDRDARRLSLARDRLGEKPLYYWRRSKGLAFASELSAFEGLDGFSGRVRPEAVAQLVRRHYISAPGSIYEDVFKVLPGHVLEIDETGAILSDAPYWSVGEAITRRRPSSVDELEALLGEAVGEQLVADVPVGVFLSGGVDSSLIAALAMRRSGGSVRTFCARFDDVAFDESGHASRVAAHLGTEHHTLEIGGHDLADLAARMGTVFAEPFADASQMPTYLISQAARREVTVALSGDGGDELFLGYRRHRLASELAWTMRIPAPVRELLARAPVGPGLTRLLGGGVVAAQALDRAEKLKAAVCSRDMNELFDRLTTQSATPGISRLAPVERPGAWATLPTASHTAEAMAWTDMVSYLPDDVLVKVDRSAMAVSLETRAPFLDVRVVEAALGLSVEQKLSGGRQKVALKTILARHVPASLMERPKQGFSPPLATWLRTSLRDWADDMLSPDALDPALFDPQAVSALWRDHREGRRNLQYSLWPVLMYQAWAAARR